MITTTECDNKWRLIKPVGSSNYVLNPSGETTGNFANVGTAVVARSTTYQKYGLYSYYIPSLAGGDGVQLTLLALTNTEHFVTVRVRNPFPGTLQATLNATKNLAFIEKIDNDWDLYGVGFSAAQSNAAATLDITTTGIGNFYIDGIQVEPLSYWTTYIDGTQPGCEWLGAQHGSLSSRSSESRLGGKSVDFYEEYGFVVERIVGAGSAPKSLGVDSYAILPGGELNSVKVQSRDFTIIGKFIADSEKLLHQNIQALDTELQNSSYVGSQPVLIRYGGAKVQKEIAVHYKGGLGGDLPAYYGEFTTDGEQWTNVMKWVTDAPIQLSAPNPYWYEVGESAALLDTQDSDTFRIVAARLRETGQWDSLGPPNAAGTYNAVQAFAEDDTYVYVGGNFTNFDNIANADYIVRYNKQTGVWSALGTGMDANVLALAIGADGTLYAGGAFTTAGGGAANYIASWNGAAWAALGAGTDAQVKCLAVGLDGTLYVGGDFANAGGAAAAFIAKYSTAGAWSALGAGLNGAAEGLSIQLDGNLYVVGQFTTAGGGAVGYAAIWDVSASSWSAMGAGMNVSIFAIDIGPDGMVYIGGQFGALGNYQYVAMWNGTAWLQMGSGMDAQCRDIRVGPDGLVYACGDFTTAGGIAISDALAVWNGSTWAHVDIDLPAAPTVQALLPSYYTDPVVLNNYDIWVGFATTGTAYYNGLVTVDNEGSVPAYPKVSFNRSGGTSSTIATLRNERTGDILLFDYGLLDGETLVVNLSPTQKSIVSSQFKARKDAILSNSDFGSWQLKPGDNDVTSFVIVAGAPTVTAWLLWRDGFDGYN